MMNSSHYCEENVRTHLACFFYAVLFLPLAQRQACMALFAFQHEVSDIAYHISDYQVAHTKLHFWHEELERYAQQKARHPVTLALQQHLPQSTETQEYLQSLLHGCAFDIAPKPILNTQDFQTYTQNHMGALQHLLCLALQAQSNTAHLFCDTLSQAWQYMDTCTKLPADMRRQRLLLPQQDRIQFQISDSQMFQAQTSDKSTALFQHYHTRIQQLCQQATEQLHHKDRTALLPILVLHHVLRQQWLVTQKDPWVTAKEKLPIQRIWVAWLTQQRERRSAKKQHPAPVKLW